MSCDRQWSEWLAGRVAARGVPGAALSLDLGGDTAHVAAGRRRLPDDAPVTPSTIFRLGSITKMLTALVLVREMSARGLGLATAVDVLWPEFPVASPAGRKITVEHLLSHAAGIFGDVPPSEDILTPDALKAYAAQPGAFEKTSPAGQWFSYSNASLALAARLSELLTGAVWDELLAVQVLEPLGLRRTGILPWLRPGADLAEGHAPGGDSPTPVGEEPVYRALAPAGSCGWSTAPDLLALGRALSAPGGAFAQEAAHMRRCLTPGPTPTFAYGWGLGIAHFDPDGAVFGHDGVAGGQQAFLRLAPEAGVRVALMTNGGDGRGLMFDLFERLSVEVGRQLLPTAPVWPLRPDNDLDTGPYVGRYAVASASLDVRAGAEGLYVEPSGPDGSSSPIPLRRDPDDGGGELFLARFAAGALPLHQRFVRRSPHGAFEALIYRGRLYPRQKHLELS